MKKVGHEMILIIRMVPRIVTFSVFVAVMFLYISKETSHGGVMLAPSFQSQTLYAPTWSDPANGGGDLLVDNFEYWDSLYNHNWRQFEPSNFITAPDRIRDAWIADLLCLDPNYHVIDPAHPLYEPGYTNRWFPLRTPISGNRTLSLRPILERVFS